MNQAILITIPANEALEQQTTRIAEIAKVFRVTDAATMEEAGKLTSAIVSLQTQVKETFDPVVEAAHKLHKTALLSRSKHLDPLIAAETHLKAEGRKYFVAQEQKRREEEERQRKLAEQARLEVERQKAEAERKQRESDELLRKAAEAEQQGKLETAETLLAKAVEAAPPPVTPALRAPAPIPLPPIQTKVEGLGSRKVWKWRCADLDQVPRPYLMLNEKLLNSLATSTKGSQQIPGIEFYQDVEMRRA